ncbi:uncharacterized protein Pyn_12894 [Prunus yedoensis var. nudiflora]|uniref:DNA/RNA-binding protein Alba-like domain-containing protein n=1 Tax=Prunus yedoensis var. nudiflora TaxID=2094558 RepID=A0A314UFE1_PRUYE|nr:uncharacterized protein Pyn_12894 [Prunus yedoensis var. nudiflora]
MSCTAIHYLSMRQILKTNPETTAYRPAEAKQNNNKKKEAEATMEGVTEGRYMEQNNEVELSALGMAIATVVTIAEILKNNGLAFEKKITTSTIDMREDAGGRPIQKAKQNKDYVICNKN